MRESRETESEAASIWWPRAERLSRREHIGAAPRLAAALAGARQGGQVGSRPRVVRQSPLYSARTHVLSAPPIRLVLRFYTRSNIGTSAATSGAACARAST